MGSTSLLVMVAVTVLIGVAHDDAGSYSNRQPGQTGESRRRVESDIVPEEPEPADPKEREARRAKSTRYNKGGADLTVERAPDSEIFHEHIWPAVDFIPAAASAVVVVGRVTKVQPYLSTDRSRVYTEISIAVDDLIKQDQAKRVTPDKIVVVDRLGGALKLKNGRIVRDRIKIDYLGELQPGRRYLVFARATNDGNDVRLIKSYELVNGRVFTNDSRPSRLVSSLEGVPATWANEAAFLKAVREATVSTAGNHRKKYVDR